MGTTQYSRSHDRHVHSLTSPPAWHHCAIAFQNNTCNTSTHHSLLSLEQTTIVHEWNTYHHLKARIWIKCELCEVWHHELCLPIQSLRITCVRCTCPNSISTISMSALYKHRGQPHTQTLKTNHGNPSVAQSFWC